MKCGRGATAIELMATAMHTQGHNLLLPAGPPAPQGRLQGLPQRLLDVVRIVHAGGIVLHGVLDGGQPGLGVLIAVAKERSPVGGLGEHIVHQLTGLARRLDVTPHVVTGRDNVYMLQGAVGVSGAVHVPIAWVNQQEVLWVKVSLVPARILILVPMHTMHISQHQSPSAECVNYLSITYTVLSPSGIALPRTIYISATLLSTLLLVARYSR